jgi:hypothetical protein
MPEVLEIEQIEAAETEIIKPKWDSWTIEIPPEIIEAQGLAEGSLATFTIKDGRIEGEIIPPLSGKLKEVAGKILKKRKKLYEELRQIGD